LHVPLKLAAGSAAAALVASLLIAAPAAAAPPPAYTCTGTLASTGVILAGTYASLAMPAGSACEIDGPGSVTVKSPVSLGSGAALFVNGGALQVRGGMTVGSNALFAADVFGHSENAPVEIDGPVTVLSAGAFGLGQETPYGPPFATIRGSVSGLDAAAVIIQNVRITGSVTISGGGADNAVIVALLGPGNSYNDFEDDQIKGSLSETGYGGVWAGVIRSQIGGSFTFAGNVEANPVDEYDIGSDLIFGSAYCADNNPVPNTGVSSGAPSMVVGPTSGNQAATCTGVPQLPGAGTGPTPAVQHSWGRAHLPHL
jgi:hypothetical protein